jgi:hypothetical protein
MTKDKTGWEAYDKTFYPYPQEGDEDVFFRKNAPIRDLDSKMNKLIVECGDRKISVFESQIRPIAKYLGEHPELPTVKVMWVQEGDRVLPRIQKKLEG